MTSRFRLRNSKTRFPGIPEKPSGIDRGEFPPEILAISGKGPELVFRNSGKPMHGQKFRRFQNSPRFSFSPGSKNEFRGNRVGALGSLGDFFRKMIWGCVRKVRSTVFLAENFFVVQTNPQRELFVSEQLSFLNPYLPRFKTLKGRIAPLFPGYLFVPALEQWSQICSTVGVRAVLKSGDHPAVIPGSVIGKWRDKERGGLIQLPPPPRFLPGQRLTITRGSLKYRTVIHAGMIGRDRERVLIEMLGQNVSLIVASADLVPEFEMPTRNRLRRRRDTFMGQGVGRFQ